jgi:hypothetical protein
MTKEEAIDLLDNLIGMVDDNHDSDYDTAIKMAIKALEQDTVPFDFELYEAGLMDMPKVVIEVLDKIRAEIEQEYTKFRNKSDMWSERACGLGTALEIIDKYKKKSEAAEQ